jgi:hypothetical protein
MRASSSARLAMWVQVSVLRTALERKPSASKVLELLRRPGDP